jgi:hypothetical protein
MVDLEVTPPNLIDFDYELGLQNVWSPDDDQDEEDEVEDRPRRPRRFPRREVVSSFNLTVPTALENHTLSLHGVKIKFKLPFPRHHRAERYSNVLFVHGQRVILADAVASNGAVHVVHKILNPRPHHCHRRKKHDKAPEDDVDEDGEWEDWEDWLPRWAMGVITP